MNKILLILTIFTLLPLSAFAQAKADSIAVAKNQDKPNIYDFDGNLISREKAMQLLIENDAQLDQIYKDGKAVGAKLIRNSMIGKSSLDFSFNTIDGKVINLSKQKGKITVLNFWYVGCLPCMAEIPLFNQIVEKYGNNKNIEFFAVTFIASEDTDGIPNLKTFLEKKRFDFQISIATKSVLDAFKIKMYPQTIILNGEGKIIFWRIAIGENADPLNIFLKAELQKYVK